MKACARCARMGLPQCEASVSDSSRCVKCVVDKQGNCDIAGVTPQQLRSIADQHYKLERELEEAEERALAENQKVLRLRKQKKLWFEKMMRAVARGIDNVEELERVEREEAEQLQKTTGVLPTPSEDLDPVLVRSLDAEFSIESLDGAQEIDWDAFLGNETVQATSSSS
ncbi:hypothetical protein J3458_022450 [Metarhizium acridum]|nr:hypothetical protein J3458_022450 [Metarhizium acridum]